MWNNNPPFPFILFSPFSSSHLSPVSDTCPSFPHNLMSPFFPPSSRSISVFLQTQKEMQDVRDNWSIFPISSQMDWRPTVSPEPALISTNSSSPPLHSPLLHPGKDVSDTDELPNICWVKDKAQDSRPIRSLSLNHSRDHPDATCIGLFAYILYDSCVT